MQRRLIIVAIVFVVGFGVGYGATWLLVGAPGLVRPEAPVAALDAPQPSPEAPAPIQPAVPADAPPEAPPAVPGAAAPADPAAAAPVDPTAADPAVEPAAAPDAPADPEAAIPEAPATPEAACVGNTCRLDFGDVTGGISVRRGTLTDGQPIDWDRDFGASDKLGLIPAGPKVKVEVRAIGYADGQPAAAQVVYRHRAVSVRGVISLVIGDKRLRLLPD